MRREATADLARRMSQEVAPQSGVRGLAESGSKEWLRVQQGRCNRWWQWRPPAQVSQSQEATAALRHSDACRLQFQAQPGFRMREGLWVSRPVRPPAWLAGAGESAAGQALREGKWIGSGCAVWGEAAYQAALPRRF